VSRPPTYWTLVELAAEVGCTPDSLRQRIHRGTLSAVKTGRDWLVRESEAQRVIRARRREEAGS
jgi:excisionase family DNA binding protein